MLTTTSREIYNSWPEKPRKWIIYFNSFLTRILCMIFLSLSFNCWPTWLTHIQSEKRIMNEFVVFQQWQSADPQSRRYCEERRLYIGLRVSHYLSGYSTKVRGVEVFLTQESMYQIYVASWEHTVCRYILIALRCEYIWFILFLHILIVSHLDASNIKIELLLILLDWSLMMIDWRKKSWNPERVSSVFTVYLSVNKVQGTPFDLGT